MGWALRWMLLWCAVTVVCVAVIGGGKWLPATGAAKPDVVLRDATPAEPHAVNRSLVYPANRAGHVIVDAVVNGAPLRMLVDTGASFVTLTPADARAAGISSGELVLSRRVDTANGLARMGHGDAARDPPRSTLGRRRSCRGARKPERVIARDELSRPAAKLRDARRQADDQLVTRRAC